jgi:hypothetical protein
MHPILVIRFCHELFRGGGFRRLAVVLLRPLNPGYGCKQNAGPAMGEAGAGHGCNHVYAGGDNATLQNAAKSVSTRRLVHCRR